MAHSSSPACHTGMLSPLRKDTSDTSPRRHGSYALSEDGHMPWGGHIEKSTEAAVFHMAVVDTEWIFRNYTRSLRTPLRDRYCKHLCGRAQGTCAFRISAFDHIYGCRCARLRYLHLTGGGGPSAYGAKPDAQWPSVPQDSIALCMYVGHNAMWPCTYGNIEGSEYHLDDRHSLRCCGHTDN